MIAQCTCFVPGRYIVLDLFGIVNRILFYQNYLFSCMPMKCVCVCVCMCIIVHVYMFMCIYTGTGNDVVACFSLLGVICTAL